MDHLITRVQQLIIHNYLALNCCIHLSTNYKNIIMETKKYEFRKTNAVSGPTAKFEATHLSFRMQQKIKNISKLFIVTSSIALFYSPLHAQIKSQYPLQEKPSTDLRVSLYDPEKINISNFLKKSSNATPFEFQSTEINAVVPNQDYFPPIFFLDDNFKAKTPIDHNIKTFRYDHQNITLDGKLYNNLRVYEILDRYSLRDKNTNNVYNYNNVYYHLRDEANNDIATVYYIDRSIGFLRTEYKVINKASSLSILQLTVAPNPAKNVISITFQIENQGHANLYIIDMNGRTVDTVFNNKQIQSGKHTIQHHINLATGKYLIRFNIEGYAPVTQKLIVQ